jgi:hypothetical protein
MKSPTSVQSEHCLLLARIPVNPVSATNTNSQIVLNYIKYKRGRGVTLTTHPHQVPRSRMSRSYTSSPPSASMVCSGTALPIHTQDHLDWFTA